MSGLGGTHIAEKNCRVEILNDLMLKKCSPQPVKKSSSCLLPKKEDSRERQPDLREDAT